MSLTREDKAAQAVSIRESFDNASATVLVDFRGVNVEMITNLRSRFRAVGVEYKVVKNNVVRKALEGSDLADNDEFTAHLAGPTAIAWSFRRSFGCRQGDQELSQGVHRRSSAEGRRLKSSSSSVASSRAKCWTRSESKTSSRRFQAKMRFALRCSRSSWRPCRTWSVKSMHRPRTSLSFSMRTGAKRQASSPSTILAVSHARLAESQEWQI